MRFRVYQVLADSRRLIPMVFGLSGVHLWNHPRYDEVPKFHHFSTSFSFSGGSGIYTIVVLVIFRAVMKHERITVCIIRDAGKMAEVRIGYGVRIGTPTSVVGPFCINDERGGVVLLGVFVR